jgi:hypothetical protein
MTASFQRLETDADKEQNKSVEEFAFPQERPTEICTYTRYMYCDLKNKWEFSTVFNGCQNLYNSPLELRRNDSHLFASYAI